MERNIKYQYFKLDRQEKISGVWTDSGEFDFISWIEYVSDNNLEKKAITLKDTKARIERIKFYENNDVWIIRFMKLREENLPYIAKENTDAADIPLLEDEYIGEDMYMLYDINTNIAMIQSNRFSLGLSRLAELLAKSQDKTDERIRLFPIKRDVDLSAFSKNSYRTLELGFANIVQEKAKGKSALSDILRMYGKFAGVSGTIKIGIGRSKDESLDVVEVDNLIAEIGNYESVVSAKVKIRDDDSARIEVVDLMDEVFSDIITYNLEPRETIPFENAATNMIAKYIRAKVKILELITIPV